MGTLIPPGCTSRRGRDDAGSNSLDAELGDCSMLIDSLKNLDAEMREVVKRS